MYLQKARDVEIDELELVSLTTDGWKNFLCAHGTPLLNINLLPPFEGSIFLDAINAAGLSKTGAWIAYWHKKVIKELEDKHKLNIVCVVMDGPSANQKACRLLTVGGFEAPSIGLDEELQDQDLLQDDVETRDINGSYMRREKVRYTGQQTTRIYTVHTPLPSHHD